MMIQRLDSSEHSCFSNFMSNKLKYDSVEKKRRHFLPSIERIFVLYLICIEIISFWPETKEIQI